MILLIVGISLLSIFAIFFLVYAFINYGIVWRSIIIAAITVAAFVAASLLRRRSLNASAEGVAVFALLLIYLDAFALRANNFFGVEAVEDEVYWGAVLILASLGFIAWHRLSAVRAASIVGWASLATGLGVLVWGLASGLEPSSRTFIAISAAAFAGLSHPLISRAAFSGTIERMFVLTTSVIAVSVAFLVSFAVAPATDWGGTVAGALVAIVALIHAAVAAGSRTSTAGTRSFSKIFATISGLAAASAVGIAAMRMGSDDPGFAVFVPAVIAVAVVLAFDSGVSKFSSSRARQVCSFAARGGFAAFALTVLFPLVAAIRPTGVALNRGLASPWEFAATAPLTEPTVESGLAVLALGCILTLTAVFWIATGAIGRRGIVLAWGTSAILVLTVALLDTVWLVLAGWLLLAASSLVTLIITRASTGPLATGSPYRTCLTGVLCVASALAYATGWASLDTWVVTSIATIVVLLSSRMLSHSTPIRAALLGSAIGVLLVGAAAGVRHITWAVVSSQIVEITNVTVVLGIVATAMLALSAFSYPPTISTIDRRVAFWISVATAGSSAAVSGYLLASRFAGASTGLLLPQYATSMVASILLFGALIAWTALRGNSALRVERIAASIALGPAVYWMVDSFARMLALPESAQSVVPITAGLLTAAGALAVTLLRRTNSSTVPRWAREVGVALVSLPAVLSAIGAGVTRQDSGTGWLVLVIAAVAVLLVAISDDGLFASTSARRYLGWLALACATAGLWWRLSGERVDAVEPYVLPLAGALIAIALFSAYSSVARAKQLTDERDKAKAAPLIALAGLLIGILPIALNAVTGDPIRAIVIFVVSAVLLLGASGIRGTTSTRPYLDAAALAGGVGVLVTFAGRALLEPKNDLTADLWLAVGLATLIIAAFGQTRLGEDGNMRWRRIASHVLGLVALTVVLAGELTAFTDESLGLVRAMCVVSLFGALHVIAFVIDRAPFTRTIAWVSIAYAAIAVAGALAADTLNPLEMGTVPIAIALLASGTQHLATHPASRSWPWLAPGVVILLAPSLLVTAWSPDLWRLVALGIAALTVLLVGVIRRLQAPFVVGVVVVLIHGFATFAPQIRAVYESAEWWVWAGAGGILLLALAIRYEQRIRNVKSVAMRIAALR